MILTVDLGKDSYDIVIERGVLRRAKELLNLDRKVLIVTDTGVPAEYSKTVCSMAGDGYICTINEGEQNKNLHTLQIVLSALVEHGFTRSDCIVAVGGGVVGDLAGFAAASYMRGIDFYNIPSTLLSQIDSSIGGKTAVDFMGYKNIVGAFYQPRKVLIDPDLAKTLSKRQVLNGLVEAVKMAATSSEQLFTLFETQNYEEHIDEIIVQSLKIKRDVVCADVHESGLRRILNFGHTVGHAIETAAGLSGLLHGECVALGMLPVSSGRAHDRIYAVLQKLGLPVDTKYDTEEIIKGIYHDKKASGDKINAVFVKHIGQFEQRSMTLSEFSDHLRGGNKK